MSKFYFAWVDKSDTTFEVEFKREDETIFGFTLQHNEGDFPALDIDLINPRVGLLSAGRLQWAWLSYEDDAHTVTPLFFGRLLGAPQSMQSDIIRLSFIARPLDYEDQRAALLASEIASSEVYDPLWVADSEQSNPDSILETKPSFWHIDRTTLEVTTSDIIEGEDGTVNFEDTDILDGSLDIRYSESPATKCTVTATVNWTQRGTGSFPVHNQIIQAFASGHDIHGLEDARGQPRSGNGMISIIPGKDMLDQWPKAGSDFGGGWKVTAADIQVVGQPPLDPVLVPDYNHYLNVLQLLGLTGITSIALRGVFERSPGFIVQVVPSWLSITPNGAAHGPIDIIWFPIWQLAPTLYVGWDAARPRQETITFTLEADVQPLLTDPGENDTILLSVGPADVDLAIENIASPRFFNGPRGLRAFQSLIARARAALLARARAVELEFDTPFEKAMGLSCRMNGTLSDPRLPGTNVGGKVKGYTLAADGDSGVLVGHVVLGCTVGHDGHVDEVAGTPEYVDPDYVTGYQEYDGATFHIPGYTDLTYAVGDYAFDDDGVNLNSVLRDEYLLGITVTGTVDVQQEAAQDTNLVSSAPEVIAKVSGFKTDVSMQMRPILDNSFVTNITPTISGLKVPRTIDTEA